MTDEKSVNETVQEMIYQTFVVAMQEKNVHLINSMIHDASQHGFTQLAHDMESEYNEKACPVCQWVTDPENKECAVCN